MNPITNYRFTGHSDVRARAIQATASSPFRLSRAFTPPILRKGIVLLLAVGLVGGFVGGLEAQTLSDLGSTAPVPGTNDISQLSTSGNKTSPDGLNYYTDNGTNGPHAAPPGQTFTTGGNTMRLKSLAIKTAGLNSGGAGYGTPASTPTYYLSIYSMSSNTATLLITLSAPNPGFTDGDWLQWSGLNVNLVANKTYAFSFGREPSGGGYVALAVATNAYAGGEIALFPIAGGTITTGSSHSFDAVFDLGLQPAPSNIPASTPWPSPTYGMNVGNCLELNWGPPNARLFYSAVQNGFNAVRIPCAWEYSGATTNVSGGVTNYVITPSYMTQVKQTVDAAIAAGMYVMINDHWDDGWLQGNLTNTVDPVVNAKVQQYWTQIATTFAGYDNHLLFAACNEPSVSSPAVMNSLMTYYQTFVTAVRAVGGNNTNRWLVLQGGGDTTWLNYLPADSSTNRLMVEYHCYSPFQFTQLQGDASWGPMQFFWGPAYHYSGDPSHDCGSPEEGGIDAGFQQLHDLYVSKGIPVMIGEFQAAGKSVLSTNATEASWNSLSCYYWNKYVVDSAIAHGMSPFYWSTGGSPLDYGTGAVNDTNAVRVLTGGVAYPPPTGAPIAATGLTAKASNATVSLSWNASSGATSYSLYRAAESGGESGIAPFVTGVTGTNYTDTNLNSGTTYYYQVVAVNSNGPTGFSPEAYAATTGSNPDPAQYNFETDAQGWQGTGSNVTVTNSSVQHYAGRGSLAVNISNTNASTATVQIGGTYILPGTTVTFHVWIPSGSKVTSIQPYMQDYNWTWSWGSYNGNLTAGAWNTVTLTVPASSLAPFHYLSLEFNTSAAWTGACYLDSVSWPIISTAPATPTNLTAVVGNGSVSLSWGASGTSTSYLVKRSLTSGGPYTTLSINDSLTYTDTNVGGNTPYYYVVSAANGAGTSANSTETSAMLGEAPYGGTPWTLPGLIQAANYDIGGQGVAYSTTSTGNYGGQYRTDYVSIETCGDVDGGYDVGWTSAGEWLNYTVNVQYTGVYNITLRAASYSTPIQGHVEFDGSNVTGLMTSATTGAWQTYTNVTAASVTLTAGQHVMKVYFDAAGWNFHEISIAAVPLAVPQNLTAAPGGGQISLSWNAVSWATDYIIQRSGSSTGTYTNLATTFSTNYIDSGLGNGATWYYSVAANGLSGLGTASAPVSATTFTTQENWRLAYFGTISNSGIAADSADPYGVGMSNLQEFQAGTDPTSWSGVLQISQLQVSGSDMLVSFASVAGKTYRVDRSDTLQNGSWVTVQDNIAGTGATIQITDSGGASSGKRFYRVVVK